MSIKAKAGRAQPVGQLFKARGPLAALIGTASLIDRAQRHLESALPAEMANHVRVGGYQKGRLMLMTDRAVWLTWLRFERERLIALLRQLPELESIIALDFKVRPLRPVYTPRPRVRHLPEEAASHLRECAREVENPGLRKSLERLAAHAGENADFSGQQQ